jgi:hypothetical protein
MSAASVQAVIDGAKRGLLQGPLEAAFFAPKTL